MRELIDLVIRTKDEKGRIRIWHKDHIDLDKLVYKVDEEYNLLPEYKNTKADSGKIIKKIKNVITKKLN